MSSPAPPMDTRGPPPNGMTRLSSDAQRMFDPNSGKPLKFPVSTGKSRPRASMNNMNYYKTLGVEPGDNEAKAKALRQGRDQMRSGRPMSDALRKLIEQEGDKGSLPSQMPDAVAQREAKRMSNPQPDKVSPEGKRAKERRYKTEQKKAEIFDAAGEQEDAQGRLTRKLAGKQENEELTKDELSKYYLDLAEPEKKKRSRKLGPERKYAPETMDYNMGSFADYYMGEMKKDKAKAKKAQQTSTPSWAKSSTEKELDTVHKAMSWKFKGSDRPTAEDRDMVLNAGDDQAEAIEAFGKQFGQDEVQKLMEQMR